MYVLLEEARKTYFNTLNIYKESFNEDIPIYSDKVTNVIFSDEDDIISLESAKRLEKEVKKRIKENHPFEKPDDYDDWWYD